MFCVKGKIALITGGASGIGLNCAKALLRNGLGGCTIADIDEVNGEKALKEIADEFGKTRVLFAKTDVTDKIQFEDAFRKTVNAFSNIDILINSAGILNDSMWEKEILINLNGTINGCLLGLENYLPKYKSGNEAVVVNFASIAGLDGFGCVPIYTATKHAVIGLTMSLSIDLNYSRTKVKMLTICPGLTDTPILDLKNFHKLVFNSVYKEFFVSDCKDLRIQPPEYVAECVVRIIEEGKNGSTWLIEHEEPPSEIIFNNRYQLKQLELNLNKQLNNHHYVIIHYTV